MQMTADMIITRGGSILPLDQRISDALMTYAQQVADAVGVPRQTWVRKTWDLKDYEAKDLLKGNASKAVYERILKLRGPHRGWHVGLAVTGAVVGQPVNEFFHECMRQAAKDAQDAQEHERIAQAAYRRLEDHTADPGEDRRTWAHAGEVGAQTARRVGGAR